MNDVLRPDDAGGTPWHAGQWILEFKPEGGGRFGPLRDPVLSPTGRLRMLASGCWPARATGFTTSSRRRVRCPAMALAYSPRRRLRMSQEE